MNRFPRLLAALAVSALTLAPVVADARPGGGFSSGSRGSRSYAPAPSTNTAPGGATRPFDRTITEPSRPSIPNAAPGGLGRPAAQGGFFSRNPFLGGLLAGGVLGAMMGGGFFSGLGSLAGVFGFLLQIALIGGLAFLLITLLRRRSQQPAAAGMRPNVMAREMQGNGGGGSVAARVNITAADQEEFGRTLIAVNQAWSARDEAALARLSTPEMVQYFRDDYAALTQRGWRNTTADVRLESGDIAESWAEGAREYCTVAMRFSLIDVTRDGSGAVVEGNATERQMVTEIWTFVRVQGRDWQLSAIQQAS